MSMVEVVARALCRCDHPSGYLDGRIDFFDNVINDEGRAEYMALARAALEALRVPSDEMVRAAAHAMWIADDKALWTDVMSAMITAALGETE